MKIRWSFPLILLSAILIAPLQAIAEQVLHSGYAVDAEGTAEACLSCHDGSLAPDVTVCTGTCDHGTPHSIMKIYPPLGKEAAYASLAEVTAKGVRTVNGRVTCISCHDLRKQVRRHLVLDEHGRHCAICHIRGREGHP